MSNPGIFQAWKAREPVSGTIPLVGSKLPLVGSKPLPVVGRKELIGSRAGPVGGGKELTGSGMPLVVGTMPLAGSVKLLVVGRTLQVCKMGRKWQKTLEIVKNSHPQGIEPQARATATRFAAKGRNRRTDFDFSLQLSAFGLRVAGAGNSGLSPQLPSAICHLPMKIVLDNIWRQADFTLVRNQHIQNIRATVSMPSSPTCKQ